MSGVNILDVRNLGHFATLYQWDFIFAKPPNLGSYPDTRALNFRCVSAELPVMQGQSIDIFVRGHHIRQHGIYDYTHNMTFMFVETLDNVISNFLRTWREACWEVETGNQGLKQDVEATVILHRLDNQKAPIWKYEVFGCFIESYDPGGQLDAQNSDAVRPSITISYDYFKDEALA